MRMLLGAGLCLTLGLPAPGGAQTAASLGAPSLIEIRVLSGAESVHGAGTRSRIPLVVQIVDATGKPVSGAAVSFLMPPDGPAGVFANGMSTEVLITGRDGKVTLRGIRWGPEPGEVALRIAAVKGRARAGTVATVYLESPAAQGAPEAPSGRARSVSKPPRKWLLIGAVAAGAVAGGLVLGLAGSGTPVAGAARAPATVQSPGVQVGAPTITVEKP